MKIIETIEGATENTVVYEDGNGARVAVTRPKIVSIEQIKAEIQATARPARTTAKTEEKKEASNE